MLELNLDELGDTTEVAITSALKPESEVCISYSVSAYHGAYFSWERAAACLEFWYVAERLAENAKRARYDVGDGGPIHHTVAVVKLHLSEFDPEALAARIVDLAPAFDPDSDGEAAAFLYDEAQGWISKRSDFRFPELEQE